MLGRAKNSFSNRSCWFLSASWLMRGLRRAGRGSAELAALQRKAAWGWRVEKSIGPSSNHQRRALGSARAFRPLDRFLFARAGSGVGTELRGGLARPEDALESSARERAQVRSNSRTKSLQVMAWVPICRSMVWRSAGERGASPTLVRVRCTSSRLSMPSPSVSVGCR